tara:strand:- start:183 stop:797 length:615 start_codon:yes stop_codon:yes gene_type:complete
VNDWRIVNLIGFLLLFRTQTLWAGEQLSPTELTQRSHAIAEVTVQWDASRSAPPNIAINQWYKKPSDTILNSIQEKPKQLQTWIGLCLPDAKLLTHWIKTYPHFSKKNIALWNAALTQRQFTSIVFLKPHPATGQLRPTCEAEAPLAQGWKNHPKISTYIKQMTRNLFIPKNTKQKPKAINTKSQAQPEAISPKNQGCSCQSAL